MSAAALGSMRLCWAFLPKVNAALGAGWAQPAAQSAVLGLVLGVKHGLNTQTSRWAQTPLSPGLSLAVWRHVDKGTPEGAIDAMLIHGQGKGLRGSWGVEPALEHGLALQSPALSRPVRGTGCVFTALLSRCHHCVQCWADSAFLGDQHWGLELGDLPGHWQVGFPVCSGFLSLQCWSAKKKMGHGLGLGLHCRERFVR